MNHLFTAASAGLLVCAIAFPQIVMSKEEIKSNSVVLTGSGQHHRLFELDRDGNRIVAVGDRGLVLRSIDGGKSWKHDNLPEITAMLGVAFAGDTTVAVGQEGRIFVHNPGSGWKEVESGTKERLLNVSGNSSGLLVAVGAFGEVILSDDYGSTWEDARPDWLTIGEAGTGGGAQTGAAGEPSIYAVEVQEDGTVFIGGELSFIVRSECGEDWTLVNQAKAGDEGIAPSINSISIRADGTGFAVGQAGMVLKTVDNGQTWSTIESSSAANLLAVASLPDGEVVAVGMRTTIRSDNDGARWYPMKSLDFPVNWYSGVRSDPASGEILAVGHSARIVHVRAEK